MNTWLNQGRLRRPGRGLKKWEKLVESKSTNRLEHKNPDTPEAWVSGGITFLYDVDLRTAYTRPPTSRKPSEACRRASRAALQRMGAPQGPGAVFRPGLFQGRR